MKTIEKLVDAPFSHVVIRGITAAHTVTFSDFVECGEAGKLKANSVTVRFYSPGQVLGFLGDSTQVRDKTEFDLITISGPIVFVDSVIESLGIVP